MLKQDSPQQGGDRLLRTHENSRAHLYYECVYPRVQNVKGSFQQHTRKLQQK